MQGRVSAMKLNWTKTGAAGVLAWALAAAPAPAQTADQPKDIGTVSAAAGASLSAPPAPGTAADVAPSRGPLDASQPTSVVGSTFIRENLTPTNNYDHIILFTPSVQNIEPAGAGLQQNYQETIRGFQYTQFNSTFDGLVLPGLPTNFAPQSEAYFLAHDIGSVTVDRGPGTASTLGYATFGGTVSIASVEPSNDPHVNTYTTLGSYDTQLFGVRVDTGAIPQANGARAMLDLEREEGTGALDGVSTRRTNAFAKVEVPVGDSTLLTFLGLIDHDHNNTPYGATLPQIRTLGPDVALNNDPKSQAYSAYNFDHYNTDFEYIGAKSDLGAGFGFDGKVYTNGYNQQGETGQAPNDPGTPNLTGRYYSDGQRITLANNVPVQFKHNDFRDWGAILRFTKDTDIGQIRAGVWFDYINASAYRYTAVGDLGGIPYSTKNVALAPYTRLYHTDLRTEQPYVEWALTPLPGLVITPGLKYTATTRDLGATVNSTTKLPARFEETYSDLQPSIDARYTVLTGLVAYAQAAKGFLAPPLNVLNTTAPVTLNPQQTWNYQAGVNYQTDAWSLSGDAYYIDFSNRIGSTNLGAGNIVYSNNGGAIYKGLEFEGTVRVGGGVSLYGNYSLNDGNLRGNRGALAVTPRSVGAAGVVYHQPNVFQENDLVYGSLIGKFVGPQYLQDTPVDAFPIGAYAFADFAVGYTFPIQGGKRTLDLKLNVNNIADDRSLIGLAGTAASNGQPLYWTNAGRSVFVTLSLLL